MSIIGISRTPKLNHIESILGKLFLTGTFYSKFSSSTVSSLSASVARHLLQTHFPFRHEEKASSKHTEKFSKTFLFYCSPENFILLFPIFFLLFFRPVLFARYNKISLVIGFSYRGFHFTHSFRARAHIERQTRTISNSLVVPTRTCSQEKLCFSFIFEIFSWGRRRKFPQHVFHVISLVQTAVARDSFRLEIR